MQATIFKPLRVLLIAMYALLTVPDTLAVGLSPMTHRQLTAIHEKIDEQAYNEALVELEHLLADIGNKGYEKAVVLQTLGYVQISREAYKAATEAFEQALALDKLPEKTRQRLQYDLAQLYLASGKTVKAIQLLERWFEQTPQADATAYALLGHAYAQDNQLSKAIPALQRAIELAEKPHADWYEALLAMHYEQESWQTCIPLLKDMLRLFPKRQAYWAQLASVHLALRDYAAATTAFELAYRDGALKHEQELIQLARLYLHTGMPHKAARLLQQQLELDRITDTDTNQQLLARAWSASGERDQAILALEKAIGTSVAPVIRLQLAQWYIEAERWKAAENQLTAVVNQTEERKLQAHGWLLIGIARYEQRKIPAALNAFNQASQRPTTSEAANQWLEFLNTLPDSNV
jgi:tetratricopeptide (TPR) repeat protein